MPTRVTRRQFLAASTAAVAAPSLPHVAAASTTDDLVAGIDKVTLLHGGDGNPTWFHPRACRLPAKPGVPGPRIMMTLQTIGGSDYFGPLHVIFTDDGGKSWTDPQPVPPLGRIPAPDGYEEGVCDVVPEYHPQTDSVLALGHVVFYRGPKFSRDQPARFPAYAVWKDDAHGGSWSERRYLEWDDPRGSFIYTNNCGQRVVKPNGDILMVMSIGAQSAGRSAIGARCQFDGTTLSIVEVGAEIEHDAGRGLLEPSLVEYAGRYWVTLRAEDDRGYVAVSDDGLHFEPKQPWAWEDGEPLGLSTTQQHWLPHSDGLYLVYTRKDAANANVIRWRSPLYLARVDLERRCLLHDTERVVLPLMGDGVNDPNQVPLMGNFHTVNVSPRESWVTVGEWRPRGGLKGDLLVGKVRWSKPNGLVDA